MPDYDVKTTLRVSADSPDSAVQGFHRWMAGSQFTVTSVSAKRRPEPKDPQLDYLAKQRRS
jgi:hypothetical protein